MIRGMLHVGISVANMDRSIVFYRDLLGMELAVRKPFGDERAEGVEKYRAVLGLHDARGEVAVLRRSEFQVELFQFDRPEPKPGDPNRPVCDHGISHFCLQVTDLQNEYDRLKAAGVTFHCPPQHFPGQAIVTYGRDPDGNVFELLELHGVK